MFVGLWRSLLKPLFRLITRRSTANKKSGEDDITSGPKTSENAKADKVILGNITLAAFLAKFAPVLFSAIPFRNTVTWKNHEACTWLAVAILIYTVLILFFAVVPVSIFSYLTRIVSCIRRRQTKTPIPKEKPHAMGDKGSVSRYYLPLTWRHQYPRPVTTIWGHMCYFVWEGLVDVAQERHAESRRG